MDIDIQSPTDQKIKELATKIVFICEKEIDVAISASNIASFIFKNFEEDNSPESFLKLVHELTKREINTNYAALTFLSLFWCRNEDSNFEPLFKKMLKVITHQFHSSQGETYTIKNIKRKYPLYAHIIGESFIQAMGHNDSLYSEISGVYSIFVETELQQEEDYNQKRLLAYKDLKLPPRTVFIKLYDELFTYINDRGRFRPETLDRENPFQYIVDLAERLRGTRIYCIQNMVQKFSNEKNKIIRQELRDKEASAEILSSTKLTFQEGLKLFHDARTFRRDYLKTDKIRVLLQISLISLGIVSLTITLWNQSLEVKPIVVIFSLLSILGGKLLCSKRFFVRFYPKNIKKELEKNMENCIYLFRKTSLDQINLFLNKQVQEPKNRKLLIMMPDFIKYLFDLMPNKKERVMSREQILDAISQLKQTINRHTIKAN